MTSLCPARNVNKVGPRRGGGGQESGFKSWFYQFAWLVRASEGTRLSQLGRASPPAARRSLQYSGSAQGTGIVGWNLWLAQPCLLIPDPAI